MNEGINDLMYHFKQRNSIFAALLEPCSLVVNNFKIKIKIQSIYLKLAFILLPDSPEQFTPWSAIKKTLIFCYNYF